MRYVLLGLWFVALPPFLAMSVATVWAHYDYDLASDAQAAIWLVVAPVFVALLGGLALILTLAVVWFQQWKKSRART